MNFYTYYNQRPEPVFNGVKFDDLFSGWTIYESDPTLKKMAAEIKRKNKAGDNNNRPCFIQKWLNFSHDIGRKSLNVEPTQDLINWIDSNMLTIEYDRIYFNIVIPEGSEHFDLYAQYNQIIGSRLLASFPLSEFPEVKES